MRVTAEEAETEFVVRVTRKGCVINLVSRRPASEPQGELLLNATSRGEQDVTGYVAAPLCGALSVSITAGYDRQSCLDLNDDGWARMPGYERFTVPLRCSSMPPMAPRLC